MPYSREDVPYVSEEAWTAVKDTVYPPLVEAVNKYEEWIDTEHGDNYVRDIDATLNSWIEDVARTVAWAEESGTGDISALDYSDLAGSLAHTISLLDPTDRATKEDIQADLEEALNSVMDAAFSAAATAGGSRDAQAVLEFDRGGKYSKQLSDDSIQRIARQMKVAQVELSDEPWVEKTYEVSNTQGGETLVMDDIELTEYFNPGEIEEMLSGKHPYLEVKRIARRIKAQKYYILVGMDREEDNGYYSLIHGDYERSDVQYAKETSGNEYRKMRIVTLDDDSQASVDQALAELNPAEG